VQREAKSWCKVEVSITDPKSIVKMGSKTAPPPPQGTYNTTQHSTTHTTVLTHTSVYLYKCYCTTEHKKYSVQLLRPLSDYACTYVAALSAFLMLMHILLIARRC
jgi:hypothetical protein